MNSPSGTKLKDTKKFSVIFTLKQQNPIMYIDRRITFIILLFS